MISIKNRIRTKNYFQIKGIKLTVESFKYSDNSTGFHIYEILDNEGNYKRDMYYQANKTAPKKMQKYLACLEYMIYKHSVLFDKEELMIAKNQVNGEWM